MSGAPERMRRWHVPLSQGRQTLAQAETELAAIGLAEEDLPFVVQLVEGPKYDLPGIDIFSGATDLRTHDRIHILLGRGLLPKDEAFVVGFTMGSTDRVGAFEERLYAFFSQYLYPRAYRFSDDDIRVFRDAVRLGFVSDCRPLHTVDFDALRGLPLAEARRQIGIEDELLRAYYAIEKRRYPLSVESQRLLD